MPATRTALMLASAAAVLVLGACASTPQTAGLRPSEAAPVPGDDASTYGLFLAGTAAANDGHEGEATEFFARAAGREDDPAFLDERAFRSALTGGDIHRAAQLAPALGASPQGLKDFARLSQIVDDMAEGQGRQAETLLSGAPLNAPHGAAGLLLLPWAAAQAGDWKVATALPDANGDALIGGLVQLDQALILERAHRFGPAEAAFHKLLASGDGGGVYVAAYGGFLERRGRKPEAIALYDAALKDDPASRLLQSVRDRAQSAKGPPPEPTIGQGAAQALLAPTANFLADKELDIGQVYLELVLRLDPDRDEAWLLLGETHALQGDMDQARAAYLRPQPTSLDYVDARAQLIATYDQPDDAPLALSLAQDTVKAAPADPDAQMLLAEALRSNDQYAESAKVVDGLIAAQGDHAGWQLYYMRGVALDQAGDWTGAQRDLNKALSLNPDDPELLNYLGYSLVDRGEQLPLAKSMIEKAIAGKPDSGALVDSLGWAYFRMGAFPQAVEQLEHAAELEPADPDINNHLGDAYWRVGRRIEARFQWERVLGLNPDAKLRAAVEEKLKSGLDPDAGAAKGVPVASR